MVSKETHQNECDSNLERCAGSIQPDLKEKYTCTLQAGKDGLELVRKSTTESLHLPVPWTIPQALRNIHNDEATTQQPFITTANDQ